MDDLISRQTAIDEIARWIGYLDDDMIGRIQLGLKRLPSAEPEIIRCKECKFYDHFWNGDWCSLKNIDVKDAEDFCSYAERGTE